MGDPMICRRCNGQGWLDCDDPQCRDSTWDHYCNAGRECPTCKGKGLIVAPAGEKEAAPDDAPAGEAGS